MRINKKITSILMAAVLTASSLVGCAGFEDTAVAMSVEEDTLSAGVVNFYCRYQQALTETYYSYLFGDDMWELEISDGVTYEDNVKDGIVTTFTELLAIEQHAEELGVSFTDEEYAALEEAAAAFIAANDEAALESVSGTYENVVRVFELFAMDTKCKPVMVQDVDTEVSDEEAAQKKVAYTAFYLTSYDDDGNAIDLTDDEIAEIYTEAESLLTEAEASGDLVTTGEELGYTVSEVTFDSESGTLSDEMLAAVDTLTDGEFATIIETDYAYYVAQLITVFDEEATETEKLNIISERETELYQATVDEWVAELEVTVYDSVWDTIEFQAIEVIYTTDSTEEVTE